MDVSTAFYAILFMHSFSLVRSSVKHKDCEIVQVNSTITLDGLWLELVSYTHNCHSERRFASFVQLNWDVYVV